MCEKEAFWSGVAALLRQPKVLDSDYRLLASTYLRGNPPQLVGPMLLSVAVPAREKHPSKNLLLFRF